MLLSFSHLLLIGLPDTRLSSLLAFPWLLWLAASSSRYDKVSSLIEGSVAFFGKSAGSDSHLIQRDEMCTIHLLFYSVYFILDTINNIFLYDNITLHIIQGSNLQSLE